MPEIWIFAADSGFYSVLLGRVKRIHSSVNALMVVGSLRSGVLVSYLFFFKAGAPPCNFDGRPPLRLDCFDAFSMCFPIILFASLLKKIFILLMLAYEPLSKFIAVLRARILRLVKEASVFIDSMYTPDCQNVV